MAEVARIELAAPVRLVDSMVDIALPSALCGAYSADETAEIE